MEGGGLGAVAKQQEVSSMGEQSREVRWQGQEVVGTWMVLSPCHLPTHSSAARDHLTFRHMLSERLGKR